MLRNALSGLIQPPIYSLCTIDGVKMLASYGMPSALSTTFSQPIYGICKTGPKVTSSLLHGTAVPNYQPGVIPVSQTGAIAACHFLESVFGLQLDTQSGANFYASLDLIEDMRLQDIKGSILVSINHSQAKDQQTIYQQVWLKKQKLEIFPELHKLYNLYYNYSDDKTFLPAKRISTDSFLRFYSLPAEKRKPIEIDEEKLQVRP